MDQHLYFEYNEKGKTFFFQQTAENGLICYNCGKKYKNIVLHLGLKEACRRNIHMDEFKSQYFEYRRQALLEKHRVKQRKYVEKKRQELGHEVVKNYQNAKKKKSNDTKRMELGNEVIKKNQNSIAKKSNDKKRMELGNEVIKKYQNAKEKKSNDKKRMELGNEVVKRHRKEMQEKSMNKKRVELGPKQLNQEINERQLRSRKRKLVEDPVNLKLNERQRKGLSIKKLRAVNTKIVQENQNKRQRTCRLVNSSKKRLKWFRKNTMYNAIFVCSCCHRKLFKSNVTHCNFNLRNKIEAKKPGLFDRSMEEHPVEINGI
jgi:hypothetical protein